MGITIHYTLISKDLQKVEEVIKIAKNFLKRQKYEIIEFEEEGVVSPNFTIIPYECYDEERYKESKEWLLKKYGKVEEIKEVIDKPTKTITIDDFDSPKGIIFHTNDGFGYCYPYFYYKTLIEKNKWQIEGYKTKEKGFFVNTETTESFIIGFYEFKNYYICDEFCKTQPFEEKEFLPNIKHHINFINTLELIEQFMDKHHIVDEGNYYDTHDTQKLVENFGANAQLIFKITSMLSDVNTDFSFKIGGRFDAKKFKYRKER